MRNRTPEQCMEIVSILVHTIPPPSLRLVAKCFDIPASMLRDWVQNFRQRGNCEDVKPPGWPCSMDARGDRELIRTVRAGPITVLGNLAVKNGVSIDTARSHLRELNKFPRHCRNKPILSPFKHRRTPLLDRGHDPHRLSDRHVHRRDGILSWGGRTQALYPRTRQSVSSSAYQPGVSTCFDSTHLGGNLPRL